MKILFFVCLSLLCITCQVHVDEVIVSSGKIDRISNFPSKYVTTRNVDVWLPEGYSENKAYQVLYMHDGQMLFDTTHTWNHQEWGIDETMSRLISEKKIPATIVVGIWNIEEERHSDYFPQKPYQSLSKEFKDSLDREQKMGNSSLFSHAVNSDNYLKFIVEELKPFIDQTYSTKPDHPSTFIAGSSMGGLISMYAICEYPEIFYGAACISTHWPGINPEIPSPVPTAFKTYLNTHMPGPQSHKIYFDYGTMTLDSFYEEHQLEIDTIMMSHDYGLNNWMTKKIDGHDHSEQSWRKRMHVPFIFLMQRQDN